MMEMQHVQNQDVHQGDSKAKAKEWGEIEATSRKVHAIAEAFRTLGVSDSQLNYIDCMSCINSYLILAERSKDSSEARQWLTQAHPGAQRRVSGIVRTIKRSRKSTKMW
jgi:hypothetical protein